MDVFKVLLFWWLAQCATATDLKSQGSLKRDLVHQYGYANFVKHVNGYLNVTAAFSTSVKHPGDCGLKCAKYSKCLSFNFRTKPAVQGWYDCEVLNTDKYSDPTKFLNNQLGSVHYRISSPCESNPCVNGIICKPLYESDDFKCMCPPPHRGRFCDIVDGKWSGWTYWTSCAGTCPPSTHKRSRTCNRPAPLNGGNNCTGANKETASCETSPCPGFARVTLPMLHEVNKAGVDVTTVTSRGGLEVSATVTDSGCSRGVGSGSIVYIKGNWTKILYTQEFRGVTSCWRIFGNTGYNGHGGVIGSVNHGLYPFDKSRDYIANQHYMNGLSGHVFSGVTKRCDNKGDNFWDAHVNGGLRYANVILRRNSFISLAGIFTGTSCGRPSYVIRDIYVHH